MRFLLITVALILLTACGQKGPLYLPDTEEQVANAGAENQSRDDDINRRNPDK